MNSEAQTVAIATKGNFPDADEIGSYHPLKDLATTLAYLIQFGATIERLIIHGATYSSSEQAEIDQNIIKYCSETLLKLELNQAGDGLLSTANPIKPIPLQKTDSFEIEL